jgi:hypothetical protein
MADPSGASLPPQEVTDLALDALEHALSSIARGGPLIPLVMSEGPDGRRLERFIADFLEEGIQLAREHLARTQPTRAVLVYDGFLTLDGQRTDALFAECFTRDDNESFRFAQRYTRQGIRRRNRAFGNSAYLGTEAPLY